ncbi:hypothetical protein Lal_00041603 [Lupinus albus]|uniref:Uncharacterized protein n=1 Tax=Lupinus albus TaxID=3870 RepID=A0A6A5MLL6_LUPAL|nr:hypothetical protein Lalb_Chr16g0389281 [Lupinus albus]KAF1874157.1 hypothetical protein Lal_00041603 [Lupinus albus]
MAPSQEGLSHHPKKNTHMASKFNSRSKPSPFLSNGCIFLGEALSTLFIIWGLCSFVIPISNSDPKIDLVATELKSLNYTTIVAPDMLHDTLERTFYDDSEMTYTMDSTMDSPMKN